MLMAPQDMSTFVLLESFKTYTILKQVSTTFESVKIVPKGKKLYAHKYYWIMYINEGTWYVVT
jgi:hypothetical protein